MSKGSSVTTNVDEKEKKMTDAQIRIESEFRSFIRQIQHGIFTVIEPSKKELDVKIKSMLENLAVDEMNEIERISNIREHIVKWLNDITRAQIFWILNENDYSRKDMYEEGELPWDKQMRVQRK